MPTTSQARPLAVSLSGVRIKWRLECVELGRMRKYRPNGS
jgi:hypothetical protein